MKTTRKEKGVGREPTPSENTTRSAHVITGSPRRSTPTRKEVAKSLQQWSALCKRLPDGSYDEEVTRRAPLTTFRAAGREILPLSVDVADAEDFGVRYFVKDKHGIPLFDADDKFSACLVMDVLRRVINGFDARRAAE